MPALAANREPRPLALRARTRPWITAHRGAWRYAPENSSAAFRIAVEQRADLVETDLWCLADGEFACHHDATLERTTGDLRRIAELDAPSLRRLRLRPCEDGAYADERVPLLDELLAILVPSWHWLLVNPWYVRRAHDRGQLVIPLDPQPNGRLQRWLARDVDAVLTNDPAGTRASLDLIRAASRCSSSQGVGG